MHPTLAKLCMPTFSWIYPRQRLFELLDEARRQTKVIWLSAPAGAGKTALIASYLEQRQTKPLWYQLDEGDSDSASFFYYLGLAAPTGESTLPLLTPEYLSGLPTFTRNYFRELFKRFDVPSIIVFDNYQDVAEQAPLHELLAVALSEIPTGITVIIASRVDAPVSYARMLAHGEIKIIDWDLLKLTEPETAGVCRAYLGQRLGMDTIHHLQNRTDGWITGLVLLLEHSRDPSQLKDVASTNDSLLFDYFAGEIFERSTPGEQEFLLKTSLLPTFNEAMVRQLFPEDNANTILKDLMRRNYFICRNGVRQDTYEYHPLFRDFLRAKGQLVWHPDTLSSLQRLAASLLLSGGFDVEAAELMLAGNDIDSLADLIENKASAFISQGRYTTLSKWFEALPPELYKQRPWLAFWRGEATLPFNPSQACQCYQQAFHLFRNIEDAIGSYLSWAGIVESYLYRWDGFKGLRPWLEQLEMLRQCYPQFPDSPTEGRVCNAVLVGMLYAYSDHPQLAQWVERAEHLLFSGVIRNDTLLAMLASQIALYHIWCGNLDRLYPVSDQLRYLINTENVPPFARIVAYTHLAVCYWATGRFNQAEEIVDRAQAIIEYTGIHMLDNFVTAQRIYLAGFRDDVKTMQQHLAQFQKQMAPHSRLDLVQYNMLSGWCYQLREEDEVASEYLKNGLVLAEQLGTPWIMAMLEYGLVQMLVLQGKYAAVETMANKTLAFAKRMESRFLNLAIQMVLAWAALQQGNERLCRQRLEELLKINAKWGITAFPLYNPRMMTALCRFAIEHDIETNCVSQLIRLYNLVPAAFLENSEQWPWRIRIFTLGRFSLLKDDKPVRFSAKTQKKPLELLKVLIAYGGRDVSESRLSETLWPDAEGDAAHSAFTTNLSRLRKLLGSDVLLIQHGKLSLNDHICWVDAWACERLLGQVGDKLAQHAEPDKAAALLQRAMHLYKGLFLQSENASWVLTPRERIRSRLLHHMNSLISVTNDCDKVIALYERTLQLDDLAEGNYRGLMSCLAAQGKHAEACALYEQCRNRLSSTFDIEPSIETQALYRAIGENSPQLDQYCKVCNADEKRVST